MRKSVLIIGILIMLVTSSFISSAITTTKEDKKIETIPTDRYSKYYFGPVEVSTSPDFFSTTSFIKKSFILKDTATTVFAWEITSGKMHLNTKQGSVELGAGSSFTTGSATLIYSGVELTENLTPSMKVLSLLFHATIIDITGLNGQAFDVKVYSREPI